MSEVKQCFKPKGRVLSISEASLTLMEGVSGRNVSGEERNIRF
jgi:hypothetical protein